ncbi:MAG: FecR domain-containing protein [Pseudomonadota bacterium]
MSGKHPSYPSDDELEAEAIELLRRVTRNDEAEALKTFSSRSPAHHRALQRARRIVVLAAQLDIRPRSQSAERWFRVKLAWARFTGHPPAVAAALIVALAIPLSVWRPSAPGPAGVHSNPASSMPVTVAYRTGWRQQDEVTLPDGSTVWLGWNTRLSITIDQHSRRVTLEDGVAAFDVVSDPDRPFDVRAGDVNTRVVGTQFVVDRQRNNRVEVSVLEGQVAVDAASDRSALLGASDTVAVVRGVMGEKGLRSAAEIGAWRDGLLVFEDRPVLEVLAAIEPYTRYRLDTSAVFGDAGRVTGTFIIERADDALVSVLESSRLRVDQQTGNKLFIARALPERP